uniref:Uncharacterized protein n=2 Tax=Clytia hemisphaerica TaxID=252671 RepID=A0A7M6DRS3_9CNID
MVNEIPVKKAHETNANMEYFGKGVEKQPNHYHNPVYFFSDPPRNLSLVQNADNNIFGKKTSTVIENEHYYEDGVEKQPNHYHNPVYFFSDPPRNLSLVQNADNNIFGKKTSTVIENEHYYEDPDKYRKDGPRIVDITEPPPTPTNPSSPGNELTVPGLGGLSIEEDIYATPNKSPALPLKV